MITKEQLIDIGFFCWFDKSERKWSWDGGWILYDVKEQTLYDGDEVYGNHIKLCVIKDIDELIEQIWFYFKIDIIEINNLKK
jgi:hypothetical protein